MKVDSVAYGSLILKWESIPCAVPVAINYSLNRISRLTAVQLKVVENQLVAYCDRFIPCVSSCK